MVILQHNSLFPFYFEFLYETHHIWTQLFPPPLEFKFHTFANEPQFTSYLIRGCLLFCLWTWQFYCLKELHPPWQPMTAPGFTDMLEETLRTTKTLRNTYRTIQNKMHMPGTKRYQEKKKDSGTAKWLETFCPLTEMIGKEVIKYYINKCLTLLLTLQWIWSAFKMTNHKTCFLITLRWHTSIVLLNTNEYCNQPTHHYIQEVSVMQCTSQYKRRMCPRVL